MPRQKQPVPAAPNAGDAIASIKYPAKRKKPWFEVEPVALHMHERISTQGSQRDVKDREQDLTREPKMVKAYRAAWRAKMDEVNACISANAKAHLDTILRLLKASGVDFPGNKNMKFSRLDPLSGVDLGDADVIETDAFDALSGLTSLPFPQPERIGKGETWRVAVKVIDPRGNEGLRVLEVRA